MKRGLIFVSLVCLLWIPVHATLGETLSEIAKRYGKPEPQAKNNKSSATWFIEGEDGLLIYTVTFDAKGKSAGEGMKPVRYAKFSQATVQTFIAMQLAPYRDSQTIRNAKPGEKYSFGGKLYTVAQEEKVVVDEANDLLIVWTQGALPSVMALRSVMM